METTRRKKTGDAKIAARIKKARTEAGFDQKSLAETLGITTSGVGLYETAAANPSLEMLVKISNACNVSTDWLLKGGELPLSEKDSYIRKLEKKIEELEITLANLMRMFGSLGKSEPSTETATDIPFFTPTVDSIVHRGFHVTGTR